MHNKHVNHDKLWDPLLLLLNGANEAKWIRISQQGSDWDVLWWHQCFVVNADAQSKTLQTGSVSVTAINT